MFGNDNPSQNMDQRDGPGLWVEPDVLPLDLRLALRDDARVTPDDFPHHLKRGDHDEPVAQR